MRKMVSCPVGCKPIRVTKFHHSTCPFYSLPVAAVPPRDCCSYATAQLRSEIQVLRSSLYHSTGTVLPRASELTMPVP